MAQAKQVFTIDKGTPPSLLDELNAINVHTCVVDEITLSCIYEKEDGPKVLVIVRASQAKIVAQNAAIVDPVDSNESTGNALDESA